MSAQRIDAVREIRYPRCMTDEKRTVQFRYLEIDATDEGAVAKECAKEVEGALKDRSRKKLAEEGGQ